MVQDGHLSFGAFYMDGLALVIHRAWKELGFNMNKLLAWFITFNFINISWVFFRAKEWDDALKVLKGMSGGNGIVMINPIWITAIAIGFILILLFKNTTQLQFSFSKINFILFGILFAISIIMIRIGDKSEFLYFNF